jgi:hypothetical protein
MSNTTNTDDVLAIGTWRTNAELIADIARMNYITDPVLDLSVGAKAGFWTQYRPASLTTNDLDPSVVADHHYDATGRTPFSDGEFATVVWDPPYKLAGTPASGEMDRRFGTTKYRPRGAVASLVCAGLTEAARLASEWVLVKVMDQVVSGNVCWLTDIATQQAADLGWRKVDRFDLRGGRPQPPGRTQKHARRNHSTLLVFGRSAGR